MRRDTIGYRFWRSIPCLALGLFGEGHLAWAAPSTTTTLTASKPPLTLAAASEGVATPVTKKKVELGATRGPVLANEQTMNVHLLGTATEERAGAGAATANATDKSIAAGRVLGTRPKPIPATENEAITQVSRAPVEAFVFHSDDRQTRLNVDTPNVTLRKGDVLLTRSNDAPETVQTSEVRGATSLRLPYEVLFLDDRGNERHCEVFVELAGGGMRLANDGSTFITQIYVGLRDQKAWNEVYSLPHALRLLVTANVDTVAPAVIELQNTTELTPVELRATAPDPEVQVQVRAADRGLELKVPVFKPKAALNVNPKVIQGFGLESAQVHIRAEGLPNPEGRSVTLRSNSGKFVSSGLKLDNRGVAHTELRSAGVGPVMVEVNGFPLTSATYDVEFAWPWRFLVFALLGGVLGSAAHFLQTPTKGRRTNWKPLFAGVLLGLLAAAASAVGVNILTISLPSMGGEVLALVAAALGAWGLVKLRPATA